MRNTLLSVIAVLVFTVSPAAATNVLDTQAKDNLDENKVVENIQRVITYNPLTKEEIAQRKIKENLKKIKEAEQKAKAARIAKAKRAREKALKAQVVTIASPAAPANLKATYAAAGKKFGVHPAILRAVHLVETGGRGDTTSSSYAGAQGPMQFMPATFRAYAVDGDGDGVANIYDVHDAIFSAAKYLAANGANRGRVENALYHYNHSTAYVNHVLALARGLGYTG